MKKVLPVILVVSLLFFTDNLFAETASPPSGWFNDAKQTVFSDFKNYYSLKNCGLLGVGLLAGGLMANTDMDENVQDWFQDDIVNEDTNDFSRAVKDLGRWKTMMPVYLGIMGIGKIFENTGVGSATGEFATDTFRGLLVGMPSVLLWQIVLGAPRPADGEGSEYDPFENNHSVSGHTFTGAVPFLTASKMTDNLFLKSFCYLGSTFTAFSRINDNQHYLSQTLLGWWFAYLAVESVHETDKKNMEILPLPVADGYGIMVSIHF